MGQGAMTGGAGGGGAGKGMPPPPDYRGIVREQGDMSRQLTNEQTMANRPNQSTPFASSTWTQGPGGQWTQQVGLTGPLGDAAGRAQLSAAEMMGQPLDYSGLQGLDTGDAARQQAIDAAYGQASSRLDPRFGRAREGERTRLLNQGLAEGSEAFNRAMGELGMQENDAYNQAMYSAIGQGREAGQAIFNQNLARRQQGLAELLQQRNRPMQDLQFLQSLTGMPGFSQAGRPETPNLLGAEGMQYGADLQRYQMQQQQMMDAINALMQLGVTGASLASDERMKTNIRRYDVDVLPGVPLATWDWLPEHEGAGPTTGVVAQDLQQVLPEAVSEGPNGFLMVDYGALRDYL